MNKKIFEELSLQIQQQTSLLQQIVQNFAHGNFSPEESLLTTIEVAKILKCTERTVRRYIEQGYIDSYRLIGKCYRIPKHSVDMFLKRQKEMYRVLKNKHQNV